jgi:hypothetical protein
MVSTPAHIPSRRSGVWRGSGDYRIMVADGRIYLLQEGEVMTTGPLDMMFTIDSMSASFIKRFPTGTSAHGILAAFLTEAHYEFLGDGTCGGKYGHHGRTLKSQLRHPTQPGTSSACGLKSTCERGIQP